MVNLKNSRNKWKPTRHRPRWRSKRRSNLSACSPSTRPSIRSSNKPLSSRSRTIRNSQRRCKLLGTKRSNLKSSLPPSALSCVFRVIHQMFRSTLRRKLKKQRPRKRPGKKKSKNCLHRLSLSKKSAIRCRPQSNSRKRQHKAQPINDPKINQFKRDYLIIYVPFLIPMT